MILILHTQLKQKDKKLAEFMRMLIVDEKDEEDAAAAAQLDSKTFRAFEADLETPQNNQISESSSYKLLLLRQQLQEFAIIYQKYQAHKQKLGELGLLARGTAGECGKSESQSPDELRRANVN